MPVTTAAYYFARGMAFAAQKNLPDAGASQASFAAAAAKWRHGAVRKQHDAAVASDRHTFAGGDESPMPTAINVWRRRALPAWPWMHRTGLSYDEPPAWPWPVRETLGAALLRQGASADAEEVFRADLRITPNNPRSLVGLAATLRGAPQRRGGAKVQAMAERRS